MKPANEDPNGAGSGVFGEKERISPPACCRPLCFVKRLSKNPGPDLTSGLLSAEADTRDAAGIAFAYLRHVFALDSKVGTVAFDKVEVEGEPSIIGGNPCRKPL